MDVKTLKQYKDPLKEPNKGVLKLILCSMEERKSGLERQKHAYDRMRFY